MRMELRWWALACALTIASTGVCMVWSSALPAGQSNPLLQGLGRLMGSKSGLIGSVGSSGLTERRGKVGDGRLSERRGGLAERRGKLVFAGGAGGRDGGLNRRGLLANGSKMGEKIRGGRRSRRGGKQHGHKIALPPPPPTPKALSVQTFFNPSHILNSAAEPIQPSLNLSGVDDGGLTRRRPRPVFDEAAPREVSGLTGTAAYLHCLVHHLGNRSVSWIRQRDLRIMTVGRYTYTTDQRFEVIHSPGSKDWILKIKYAQVRDSGNYECQVSTKPVMAFVVRLSVFAAAQAAIIGAPDMHVDMGSTINLTCLISHTPEPPDFIIWYHNGEAVNYDSPRGGITVVTERGNTTSGYLLIQDARASDTGNYSCVPSNTAPATLRVHVLQGETPAAMQTNGGASLFQIASQVSQVVGVLMFIVLGYGGS